MYCLVKLRCVLNHVLPRSDYDCIDGFVVLLELTLTRLLSSPAGYEVCYVSPDEPRHVATSYDQQIQLCTAKCEQVVWCIVVFDRKNRIHIYIYICSSVIIFIAIGGGGCGSPR